MKIFRPAFILFLIGAMLHPVLAGEFRAGAHAENVTPAIPTIATNGAMSEIIAKGVNDQLYARCLVLDDGKTSLAIAIVDSCMIDRELFDRAKAVAHVRTGIPVSHMLIAATHSHTAPAAVPLFQTHPDPSYRLFLAEKIADGIVHAHANLEPAQAGWATGSDPTQVFNRRWRVKDGASYTNPFGGTTDRAWMNPGYNNDKVTESVGPTDPSIPMLSVQARDGRPIALLANYALHYVGGVQPISGDYFGEFSRVIAEKVGTKTVAGKPPFVGILSNGASGDINNVNFSLKQRPASQALFEQIRIVTESVTDATMKAYRTIQHQSDIDLAMVEREIELGVRKPTLEEVAAAHKLLAETPRIATGPFAGQFKPREAIYARETILMHEYPPTVHVKLQALRIGEVGIVATPCETFVEIGLDVKKQSSFKNQLFIELANGYNGYLPTPQQHELGGYETWRARSSYLATDASPKVTQTLVELLGAVRKR